MNVKCLHVKPESSQEQCVDPSAADKFSYIKTSQLAPPQEGKLLTNENQDQKKQQIQKHSLTARNCQLTSNLQNTHTQKRRSFSA